jgi:hypothetical protein
VTAAEGARIVDFTPRRTVHTGVVSVSALWIAVDRIGSTRAAERVLASWEPGVRVRSSGAGFLVEFRTERPSHVDAVLGLPLAKVDGALSSAPLTAAERARIGTLPPILLLEHGHVLGLDPASLSDVDPAEWLDVSGFAVEAALAPPEPRSVPIRALEPKAAETLFDRQTGRTAADRERQRQVVESLTRVDRDARAGTTPAWRPLTAVGRGIAGAFRSALGAFTRLVRTLAGATASRPGSAKRDAIVRPREARGPSLWDRIVQRLTTMIARSRVMMLLGRRQAEYLGNLLDLLDAHRDLEVLKHAIPLSKESVMGDSRPALGAPSPRDRFEISLGRTRAGPSIGVVPGLFQRLRDSYEAVFRRLDEAGKIDEAAFVLADLLDDAPRAVAYLERHRRYLLAAELAEARELPVGLVVRQWFLAGDRERAMAIAARAGAFLDAIDRLEKSGHRTEADALRLLYAARLGAAGKFVAAAQVAHRIEQGKRLVLEWLRLARAGGDFRGVAIELLLDEGSADAVIRDLAPWLRGSDSDDVRGRAALGLELLSVKPPAGKAIAREVARELLCDAGRSGDRRTADEARDLADWIGGPFRADMPEVVTFERRVVGHALAERYPASDAGTRPVFDVGAVGQGFVVALGEAGVLLLNRHGRTKAHFDVPAHELVVSPGGHHLLAVAPRGDAIRVSRIHLGTRKSEPWAEIQAHAYAREFDGVTWAVAIGRAWFDIHLAVHDVVDERPTILNRIPLVEGGVDRIDVHENSCSVFAAEPLGRIEWFRFELPSWILRERSFALRAPPEDGVFFGTVAADGPSLALWETYVILDKTKSPNQAKEFTSPLFTVGNRMIDLPSGDLRGKVRLIAKGGIFAVVIQRENDARVLAGDTTSERILVDVTLEGTTHVAARLDPPILVLGDDAGRVLSYDVPYGVRLTNQRVR